MKDILRPILELLVVLPGLLLGYFPVKTYLKQSPGRLAAWLFPLMACLCIVSGLACYRLHASTVFALAGVALAAICLYTRTLTISLWKSGTIALSVCAVFACVNSLSPCRQRSDYPESAAAAGRTVALPGRLRVL